MYSSKCGGSEPQFLTSCHLSAMCTSLSVEAVNLKFLTFCHFSAMCTALSVEAVNLSFSHPATSLCHVYSSKCGGSEPQVSHILPPLCSKCGGSGPQVSHILPPLCHVYSSKCGGSEPQFITSCHLSAMCTALSVEAVTLKYKAAISSQRMWVATIRSRELLEILGLKLGP